MAEQLLVSFIIPVFNQEKYLACCLESILRAPKGKYEIILVDDASTDGTEEICRWYLARHDHISYIPIPENRGPGAARNIGIEKARGMFLGFPDSDDVVEAGVLAEIFQTLEANPDVDVLCPNHATRDGNGVVRIKNWVTERGRFDARILLESSPSFVCCPLWAFFVRTSFLREHCLTMPETYGMEDLSFAIQIFSLAKQAYAIPLTWYIHRNNPASLSNQLDSRHNEEGFAVYCRIFSSLPEGKKNAGIYTYAMQKTIVAFVGTASRPFLKAVAGVLSAGADNDGSVRVVADRFSAFTAAVRAMPGALEKGVYLFPATMFSPNAAQLIEASGITVNGMFDNNPSPENHQVALCQAAGYQVRPWSEFAGDMLAVVYCFEIHTAEVLARQLEEVGLVKGERYISYFDS